MPSEQYTPDILHSSAIMQHEMSAYLPIGPDARARYSAGFGGLPIIGTLHRKPEWERALIDIEKTVASGNVTEKRIVWYIREHNLTAIVEQVKMNGDWIDGQVLSLSQLIKNGHDSMDSDDAVIVNRLAPNPGYDKAAKIIIPILANSDRLFYGDHHSANKVHVIVEKEEPYLSFHCKGAQIEISSNMTVGNTGNVPKHTVSIMGPGRYSMVSVNALQKDVIKRFLNLGHVPATALLNLRRSIDSLKGIISIREDGLDQLMRPAILSSGILALRITPTGHEYDISIMATAFEDGTGRFVPADGDVTVYDEVDGLTHCINRNFEQEYSNYLIVKECLEQYAKAEFSTFTNAHVSSDQGLLFLVELAGENRDKFFIEWPEGKRLKFKGEITGPSIEISVKSDKEWFSVTGKVSINGLDLNLENLIRACCDSSDRCFIKISDDEYARMSDELRRHIASLSMLPVHSNRKRQIPKYLVGALASAISGLNVHVDGEYRDFEQKTKEAFETAPQVPEGLNAVLRDYQIEGYKWMCRLSEWGAGACLADDMGLGKTLQALAFMLHKSHEGPSLVVAPKSVLPNWEREITRFTPSLKTFNLNCVSNRTKVVSCASAGDIILCTYGVLGTQSSLLASKQWNVVCLDEAHQIKNRNTIVSQAAMDLNAASRIALTGTPLQNNLGELWNLFQFLNPGLLGQWSVFRDSYIIHSLDRQHRDMLKDMTTPFILRRTKQDVLSELPDKIVLKRMVELTDNEMKVYETMRKMAEIKFKSKKTKDEKAIAQTLDLNYFAELTKLRLAACSMKLVHDEWTQQSSKISSLMEVIENLLGNPDNNIIVFSQFTSFMDLIRPELKKKDIGHLYLDGQTPLQKRQDYVDDFQQGRCRLLLSSLKAGGLGINLTTTNYVILLDPWWNPSIENQAMDRAHRLGQNRVVSVIRLISAQTIEEKILQLHEDKQNLSDDILEGTGESGKLTYEDVMDMVSPF